MPKLDVEAIKTAAGMALASQGLPPEVADFFFERLGDVNDLLVSTVEKNRAQAIGAKVQAAMALYNFDDGAETKKMADALLEEVHEDIFGDDEEPEEAPTPEPTQTPAEG